MPSRFTTKEIWRHNGAIGQARFIEVSANAIATLPTATKAARDIAEQLAVLASILRKQLKERNE